MVACRVPALLAFTSAIAAHIRHASAAPISYAPAADGLPHITAIEHASVLLTYNPNDVGHDQRLPPAGFQLYSDPVDYKEEGLFDGFPIADIIVITHSHSDHLQPSTIRKLIGPSTRIVAPKDVAGILISANRSWSPKIHVLSNWQSVVIDGYNITAVPMYNTEPNPFHPMGKWNGYVIRYESSLVYLSGDTSLIPEMKSNFGFEKRFDHAFLCMNLPYTMGVQEAARATALFLPKVVTPYHYRNADKTFSNLTEYQNLVQQFTDDSVHVDIMDFYPYGPYHITCNHTSN